MQTCERTRARTCVCVCVCVCTEREREVYCFPEVWFVGRKQGRQNKRREDNIREWAGLEFAKSQRAVENLEKWRKLVVKSSVVPQRPSRLRDR